MSEGRERSTEDRLRDLKALHADGLITDAEYSEKLQLVVDQLGETQTPQPTPPPSEPEPIATPEADVYESCATPGCYEKRIAGSFCPKHRRSKVTPAAQSMKKSPGGWKFAEKSPGGWKSAEKSPGGVFYVASGLLIAIVIALVFAFGEGDSTSDGSPSTTLSHDELELRNDLLNQFYSGVKNNATCAELYSYRNDYPDNPQSFDPELREIGCFSSSSERTDKPSSSGVVPVTNATASFSTSDFMEFLTRKLVGSSYSIESPKTPFGKAQIESLTYRATGICRDLDAGVNEGQMREELAETEKLGDPTLDKDIPMFVEAIFSAAKTYVCP